MVPEFVTTDKPKTSTYPAHGQEAGRYNMGWAILAFSRDLERMATLGRMKLQEQEKVAMSISAGVLAAQLSKVLKT